MQFALAGFGREVAGNVVDMIGERAAMNRAGPGEAYVALGGRPMDLDALGFVGEGGGGLSSWVGGALQLLGVDLNSRDGLAWEAARATGLSSGHLNLDLLPNARDLLVGSSFEVSLGGADDGASGAWTLWGVGGDMDEVHSLRNEHAADLVHLIDRRRGRSCGSYAASGDRGYRSFRGKRDQLGASVRT